MHVKKRVVGVSSHEKNDQYLDAESGSIALAARVHDQLGIPVATQRTLPGLSPLVVSDAGVTSLGGVIGAGPGGLTGAGSGGVTGAGPGGLGGLTADQYHVIKKTTQTRKSSSLGIRT